MNQICINVVYILCSILLFSCDKNNNVTSYKIKSPQPAPTVIENISEQLNWTKPKGWIQNPATNMRLASFEVSDLNKNIADVSISMFPGNVGGIKANVNRWRGQIDLPPQNEEDIMNNVIKEIHPFLGECFIFKLENNINNKAITVIISEQNNQTLFIKISGSIQILSAVEEEFGYFYKSLHWGNNS